MSAFDVPPQLVAELAVGADNPDAVASRYGLTADRWEQLKSWKPFIDAVEQQRAEFERSGYTFKVKSAMKADAISDALFVQAMRNDATLLQRLEALKIFAKLGELEPSPKAAAASGPSFSITIDLGSSGQKVVQVQTKQETCLEVDDAIEVSATPAIEAEESEVAALVVPDFDITPVPKSAA